MKIKNNKTGKVEDIRLPKVFKAKWIKALKSGKYKQGSYTLYDKTSNNYCCLGVACRIEHPKMHLSDKLLIDKDAFKRIDKVNIPNILKGDGIDNPIVDKLAKMNDSGKHSFKSIAAYIERYL